MRMHRGSSKGTDGPPSVPGSLPLSASSRVVAVELEFVRGSGSVLRTVEVPAGTPIRAILRSLGVAAEGSAVFDHDRSIPLDTRLEGPRRLRVVSTFSGG
jgi:sulfur carrier protein ThiS